MYSRRGKKASLSILEHVQKALGIVICLCLIVCAYCVEGMVFSAGDGAFLATISISLLFFSLSIACFLFVAVSLSYSFLTYRSIKRGQRLAELHRIRAARPKKASQSLVATSNQEDRYKYTENVVHG